MTKRKRTNKKKFDKTKLLITGGLIVAVFAVVGVANAVVGVANANVSFWDRVASFTGQGLADRLADKVEDSDSSTLFGGVSGRQFFDDGVTQGGRYSTTSPAGLTAYTLSAKDFRGTPTYIDWLPNDAITLTVGATSTRDYVPNVGDMAKIVWRNASTTANARITFAAEDSGLDFQYATSSASAAFGDLNFDGSDFMEWTIIREQQNMTTILVDEFTEAD